jgi:succinyl-diaminopimelate desuccinylase
VPAYVSRANPYVLALVAAVGRHTSGESMSVGRDGASDAVSFLHAGIPAVEFGPAGAGHHGPEEWVSIASLARYRQALRDFVLGLPDALERPEGLRAVDGGLA